MVIAYNFAQGFRVSWENSNLSFMSLDQCRVPIYILPVLTIPYFEYLECSDIDRGEKKCT